MFCLAMLPLCAPLALASETEALRALVEQTEHAFAQTMADRDFEAFKVFLSDEAVFFAGETPLNGKEAVASAWSEYFQQPEAPFSWEPDSVVVLESGALALSSGPVRDPAGNRVATFQSVWRLDEDGAWRVVFDKGHRYCPPPVPPQDQ